MNDTFNPGGNMNLSGTRGLGLDMEPWAYEARGRNKGLRQGRQQGREEGFSEGHTKGYQSGRTEGFDNGLLGGVIPPFLIDIRSRAIRRSWRTAALG